MNLWIVFLTGLTTGGLTCLAVQGGLLASCIAQRTQQGIAEQLEAKSKIFPILAFLLTKLVAYTILGGLLGYFGSVVQLKLQVQAAMQLFAGLFMLATAANILHLHPIFRYVIIQPPRFITRFIRNEAKSQDIFAPALLGFMTIFIPCGTTQAMMVLAITSGNPLLGALILFAFTVGTTPIFFSLAYFTTRLGSILHAKFMRFAAYGVAVLGILAVNTGLTISGSPITLSTVKQEVVSTLTIQDGVLAGITASAVNGVQEATIQVYPTSYTPNNLTVKAGIPVKLNLVTNGVYGCTRAFTIPKLGYQKILPETGTETVEFTPNEVGPMRFTCSMGMFSGTINVVEG